MKTEVIKQSLGIDVGSKDLHICYKQLLSSGKSKIKGTRRFDNTPKGISEFYDWYNKKNDSKEIPSVFVMEATGVYYEDIAYYLLEHEEKVCVMLALAVKYFAKSKKLKTKNDKVDSKLISDLGIERNFTEKELWTPPTKDFKLIRDITREHSDIKKLIVRTKSQIHAMERSHIMNQAIIEMKHKQLEFYDEQISLLEAEIVKWVNSNEDVKEKIDNICTMKGVKTVTVVKVLAETNGFTLFSSIRQLVSYAGLDIVENESGTFKGKTKISKKGNARLRNILYMPAVTASTHNSNLKEFYDRINENRKIKRQGTIAVMRKILILIYTLWNKNEAYDCNYNIA